MLLIHRRSLSGNGHGNRGAFPLLPNPNRHRKGSQLLKQLEVVALCCGDGAAHGVVGFLSSGFVLCSHLQKKQEVIIFIFLLSEERMALRMAAGCR